MHSLCFLALLVLLHLCDSSDVEYSGPESERVKLNKFSRFKRDIPPPTNFSFQDDHIYYTSHFFPSLDDLWFDLAGLDDTEIIPETGISDLFRVYDAHDLQFDFPFYGHTINLVAVTTGGFLYTSDYLHSSIHLTQYIAPLQADFDPSLHDTAKILIHSSTERFTVQWDGIYAADHLDDGPFTFQVSLFPDGTIHFVYRSIPLRISEIVDEDHPVEVGLADSFYVDTPLRDNFILREVYEYHRISLQDMQDNLNYSAYILNPIPGCIEVDTCSECVAASETTLFSCGWCGALDRCSDGVDRYRQEWFESGCVVDSTLSCSTTTITTHPTTPITTPPTTPLISQPLPFRSHQEGGLKTGAVVGISVGVVVIVLLVVLIVIVAVVILVYGYKHPTSPLGMFMIEHRPKARSLNKSKASYEVDSNKIALDS